MDKNSVVVVGAGLSGLTAAYRIQTDSRDVQVTVLEANSYPGGRMLSTDFGGEAGGESIGFYYGALQKLAKEIGVEIATAPMTILNPSFNIAYYFDAFNKWVEQKDWAKLEDNPLPSHLRNIPPIMLLRYFVNQIQKPDLDDITNNPEMKKLASLSLLEFLQAQEAPDKALPFIESNFEVNNDLTKISALTSILKTWITQPMEHSKYYFINGGNQELPKAISRKLKNIKFNKKVVSIKKIDTHLHEVETSDGDKYQCNYVILSVPVGPMRKIRIEPPLEGLQKEAFDKIHYTPSIKVFYKVNKKFWEEDRLPIFMWTDTDINMVIPVYDKDSRENPLVGDKLWGIYTISNGVRAKRLYDIKQAGGDIAAHCQEILEHIRPSMKGALETVEIIDWGNNDTAMGAFHYYEPNSRILDYYSHIAMNCHGRYFAGEHTEYKYKGFEAATQSGVRAAREVCKNIGAKRILIIGCGNLGTALAKKWYDQIYDIRVTTTTRGKMKSLSGFSDEVCLLTVNDQLENVHALEAAMADRDIIVSLIGPVPGKAKTPTEIEEHYSEHLLRPAKIITSLLKKRSGSAPHVIFASSLSIYGTGEQTDMDYIDEDTPPSPTNPSAEVYNATESVYLDSGLPVTILRLGALYDRNKNAFVNQARLAVEKMGGMSHFDPDGLMNKLSIWDAANAIDFVAKGNHQGIFNVCDQQQVTIKTFFDQICEQHWLGSIQHLGMIKGARKRTVSDKLFNLGFRLTPPKVLVCGSGELSSYFVSNALKRGHHVTMTTTTAAKVDILREQYGNKVEVLVMEGNDTKAVTAAMKDKDIVVIAVAPKKDRLKGLTFDDNFYQVLNDAYKGTAQNVVKGWQQMLHKPQVIYVSAHSVYSDTNGDVVDENTYPLPRHRLASMLREAELSILDWIPDSTVLRMGWLLSPRRNWQHTLSFLTKLELPGDGRGKANLVHIVDAANSIMFSIDKKLTGIYNICNDAHPSWGSLWEVVSQHLAIDAPTWNEQIKDEWFEGNHIVSSEKIKNEGFRFRYPYETGLSFIVNNYEKSEREKLKMSMVIAWIRSMESKKIEGLFEDRYAEKLCKQPNIEFLALRTKLIDDEILKEVSSLSGQCQIVILGAGMDTRALRLEALSTIPVFEIDLPLVMETKAMQMRQFHFSRDDYVQISADLEMDDWQIYLMQAGYRQSIPTIWIAEGVLTYLNDDRCLELLKDIYTISASESIVIADIPPVAAAKNCDFLHFTCDDVSAWFGRSKWSSVQTIEPNNSDEHLEKFRSTEVVSHLYRAQKVKIQ